MTKEESIQGDFLNNFFTDVLGYKNRYGNTLWNITQEQKTLSDRTKSDGALGFFTNNQVDIRAVIELKDTKTDLDQKQKTRENKLTPVEQAFMYVSKSGKKVNWVIVSNFKEIRLYNSSDQSKFEQFFITKLTDEKEFKRFYFLLCYENLINCNEKSIIDKLYEINEEKKNLISRNFYKDYKLTRFKIFQHLKSNNKKFDELLLFEKSQKLMDRFIFVCFCEDYNILPYNIFREVIKTAKKDFNISDQKM